MVRGFRVLAGAALGCAVAQLDGVDAAVKVSSVSLLLPTDRAATDNQRESLAVSREVSASPGCFEWISSDDDVVVAQVLEDDSCPGMLSSSALLTVTANTRSSCEVSAISVETGETVTVEVYAAPIDKIAIMTTVRRLSLTEPETVEVQGYDELGNVFSSLSGLSFEWAAAASGNETTETPLEISRISESQVVSSYGLEQERFGGFGYKVQVSGRKPGQGSIRAKLTSLRTESMEDPIDSEVIIDVIEHLELCPSNPYVIPETQFQAVAIRKEKKDRKDKFEEIRGNYGGFYEYLATPVAGAPVSSNETSVVVDPSTGVVTAMKPGLSRVVFRQHGYIANSVSSLVRVVSLDNIKLWLAPIEAIPEQPKYDHTPSPCLWSQFARFPQDKALPKFKDWMSMDSYRWLLTKGKRYLVMATLSSNDADDSHILFVESRMKFDFHAEASSHGGGGRDLAAGQVTLAEQKLTKLPNVIAYDAAQAGYVDMHVSFKFGKHNHQVTKRRVQITDPISVERDVIRIPIDLSGKSDFHHFRVVPKGGTGEYLFFLNSTEMSLTDVCAELMKSSVYIDQNTGVGVLRENIAVDETVVVRDALDTSNSAKARVIASPPKEIKFEDAEFTIAVKEELELPLLVRDGFGFMYDNCTGLNALIEWDVISGDSVKLNRKKLSSKGMPKGICGSGWTIAQKPGVSVVRAKLGDLESRLTITVREEAHIIGPKANPTLGTTGGSPAALSREGAPLKFKVAGGTEKLDFQVTRRSTSGVMESISASELNKLVNIEFQRVEDGNKVYHVLCKGQGEFDVIITGGSRLKLHCAKPKSVQLKPVLSPEQQTLMKGCDSAETMYSTRPQVIELAGVVRDEKLREFSDLRGFNAKWVLEGATKNVHFGHKISLTDENPGTFFRNVHIPAGFTGKVVVRLEVTENGDSKSDPLLSAKTVIVVSDDVSLDASQLSPLFADSEARGILQVKGGPNDLLNSLYCRSSNPKVASVLMKGRTATISYNGDGSGLEADISCNFRCVLGSKSAHYRVKFRRAAKLQITGRTMVAEGGNFKARVQAFDEAGVPFTAAMLKLLQAQISSSPSSHLKVSSVRKPFCVGNGELSETCEGALEVDFDALKSGNVALEAFSAKHGGLKAEHGVLVYPGLRFEPSNERVIEPGVEFRLMRQFGPFPNNPEACEFVLEKGSPVKIVDAVRGIFKTDGHGSATVRAVCKDSDGQIIDEASVPVQVQYLGEMSIIPSVVHLVEGERVRLRVHFPEMNGKEINYDTIERTFTWSIGNQTVVQVQGQKPGQNEFSLSFEGVSPGATEVHVESHSGAQKGILKATAKIGVERALKILGPKYLLMPRSSTLAVKTNLNSVNSATSSLSYHTGNKGCEGCNDVPVSVSSEGIIFSERKEGVADVSVDFRSTYEGVELVQTQTVHVRVEKVAFVGIKETHDLLRFPIGAGSDIHVSLFDANGREFTSPFGSLDVNANTINKDVAVAQVPRHQEEEPSPYRRVSVNGIRKGDTSLVVHLDKKLEPEARPAYARIEVLDAIEGLSFNLDTFTSQRGTKIIAVPGDKLEIPINTINDSFSSKRRSMQIGCTVSINGIELESRVSSDVCVAKVPADLKKRLETFGENIITIALSLGTSRFAATTAPFELSFKIWSMDLPYADGLFAWPKDKPVVVFNVLGTDASLLEVKSSVGMLETSYEENQIIVKRSGDPKCGEPFKLRFAHKATGEKQEVQVASSCSTSLNTVATNERFIMGVGTLLVLLVLLVNCCGR